MTKLSRKIKYIFLIDVFLFVVCILGIYQVSEKAGLEAKSHVSFEEKENKVYVLNITDKILLKKLFPGDELTAIKGYPVSCKEDIEFILDACAIGDIITFNLVRNGVSIERQIELLQYYSTFYIIVQIIVGCTFFLLALFVIYKRPNLLVANVWHWSSIGTAIIIMCTWGRYTIFPQGSGHLTRIIFSTAYAFVPALFLQLSFVFPKNKFRKLDNLIYPIFGFSVLLALWMNISFIFASVQLSMDWFFRFLIAFDFNRLYFAMVILFGMGNIIHSYIKATEESERRKIRWVLMGLAIGPPAFVIFWQIPQLLGFDSFISEEIIVLFMLIVPVTFSISIVKYNIFDIDLIIHRSTVYFIVVSLLITIYAIIVGLTVLLVGTFTLETSLIASVAAAVLIPVFFEPLRQFVKRAVDKKFFHVRYNYRLAQRSISSELNDCMNIDSIAKIVIKKLDDLLKPECIGIYLLDENRQKWKLYCGINCESISEKKIHELNTIDKKTNSKIYSSHSYIESEIEFEELLNHQIRVNHVVLITSIKSQQKDTMGFLVLGKKKSGARYSQEDIDLFNTVSLQTGIRIERIQLQKELILKHEKTEKLEEINRLKSFFVSSVSHDLQTPLTSIKMFAELLQTKKSIGEKDKTEYLEIIQGESERLSRLIKNILDFSKIERGVKEYHFSRLNLVKVLDSALKLMDYQLRQSGFNVELNFTKEEIMVNADEDALITAFINIFSNALKYSTDNKFLGISVKLKNHNSVIKIQDKGLGISPDEQVKIFETFYRSRDSKIQNLGGAGLGLTLVSHIINAHNGKIEVDSRPGQGSTFILYLPLEDLNE